MIANICPTVAIAPVTLPIATSPAELHALTLPSCMVLKPERLEDRPGEPGLDDVGQGLEIEQFAAESIEPSGWSYRNILMTGAIRNTSGRTLRGVTYSLYSSGVKVKEGTMTVGPNTTMRVKSHFPTSRGRKLKLKLVVNRAGTFGEPGVRKSKEIEH